jgi:hypothetical protein
MLKTKRKQLRRWTVVTGFRQRRQNLPVVTYRSSEKNTARLPCRAAGAKAKRAGKSPWGTGQLAYFAKAIE